MRNIYFDYLDHRYRLVIRDDHAALLYRDNDFVTSIWPFHSERQDEDTMVDSAKQVLAQLQLRPATSIK
jgi:hypothetical protein